MAVVADEDAHGEVVRLLLSLDLKPEPSEVPRARHAACRVLSAWFPPTVLEVVELLVSELVTNAVRHTRAGGLITLAARLLGGGTVLEVRVADGDRRAPVEMNPGPGQEGGRGLWLCGQLADRVGWDAEPGGKSVWFQLDLDEQPTISMVEGER